MASSATNQTTETPQATVVQVKNIKCVSLDCTNYYTWRAQFLAMLRGNELQEYINRKIYLSSSSIHFRQDQLILSLMFSTISATVLLQIPSFSKYADVWKALEKIYSSDSDGRVLC